MIFNKQNKKANVQNKNKSIQKDDRGVMTTLDHILQYFHVVHVFHKWFTLVCQSGRFITGTSVEINTWEALFSYDICYQKSTYLQIYSSNCRRFCIVLTPFTVFLCCLYLIAHISMYCLIILNRTNYVGAHNFWCPYNF